MSSNLELGSPFPSPSKIVRDLTARDRFRGELGSREGATSRNPLAGGGGGGQAAAVAYMLPTGQELYDLITPFLDYDHLQNKPDSFFVEYSEDKVFWIDTDIVTEFRKIFEETDFFLNIVDSNEIYVGLILSNGVLFGYSPEMDSFYTTISSGTIRIEQGSSFFQGDIISNHTWRANVRRFQCENITRSGAFLDDTLVNIRFSFKANFVRWSIDRINWLEFDLRIDISEIESQVQTDWEEMDADSLAFLLNKPEIEPQVQTDWEETDTDLPAFLLNKPDISDVSDFLNQAEILALLPDVSDFLNQAEILALLPDVSDFLNQAEILALLPDCIGLFD